MIKDHFTGYLIGKCQRSKASPLNWIRNTLTHFASGQGVGENRYVHMDQGGELYNNPKVRKIFEKRGFAIHPTGADASHQNGLVKRAHRTVAKGMRSFLVSSGAPIKFWPYAFKHYL